MKEKVGLYIHIPFCKSKCAYCDFFSCTKKEDLISSYINALCNEFLCTKNTYPQYTIDTVFIGGGTPSLIPPELLKKLCSLINSFYSPKEFTIEANPDDITEAFLKTLDSCKITRLSIGIQSLNEKSLKECHRRADSKTNINALGLVKKFWKKDFSIDLISALPYETEETLKQGIEKILEYKPDHISLYSLMLEEETPLYNTYKAYDSDTADKLWLYGRDILLSNGYNQYEVSNFCKAGKECLHNLKYWQQENYFGLGSGATGTIYKKDEKGFSGERRTNTKEIENYIKYWEIFSKENFINDNFSTTAHIFTASPCEKEELTEKTCQIEFFMMGLRLLNGINEKDFYNRYKIKIPKKIHQIFQTWQNKKLAEIKEEENYIKFSLNKDGILFLNKILEEIISIYY